MNFVVMQRIGLEPWDYPHEHPTLESAKQHLLDLADAFTGVIVAEDGMTAYLPADDVQWKVVQK